MEPDGAPGGVVGMDVAAGLPAEPALAAPVPDWPAVEAPADGFAAFYEGARDPVARALALTLGDVQLGAEAADEAMARAYQRWSRIAGFDDPAGWAYRVGLNWASSVLRRRRRAPLPRVERGPADVDPVPEPSVVAALAALDARQRAVVVCRFYLGLSEAETAAALGARPGTVKSRLHRALRQLERTLDHLRPEEGQ